jgi:hypothetical protein
MRRSREEGMKEGISQLIRNCYKNGMSIEQITIFTGLPEKEIKAILLK